MDRALKERIIGAIVLVAIIVLVVPVFLDGPATEQEMISETVLLPGQSRSPQARKTVVLQRDRDEPLPGPPQGAAPPAGEAAARDAAPATAGQQGSSPEPASSAPGESVADSPASETRDPEPEPPREESAREPAQPAPQPEQAEQKSATGMWAVQLGSFSNKANADRLAASLREDGYAAFLSQHRTSSGELHRVRIGPQKDRASAEAVAARLSAAGLKGQVVPHP